MRLLCSIMITSSRFPHKRMVRLTQLRTSTGFKPGKEQHNLQYQCHVHSEGPRILKHLFLWRCDGNILGNIYYIPVNTTPFSTGKVATKNDMFRKMYAIFWSGLNFGYIGEGQTFRRNLSPPSSGYKSKKARNKPASAWYLLDFVFSREDGGDMSHRNIGLSPNYTTLTHKTVFFKAS
jgi:hypothetical protein